jgi:hypothetical protein
MRGLGALLALALLPGCLGGGGGAAAPAAPRFPGPRPTRLPTDASVYLQRIRVGYGAYDLATGDGGLWVAVAHGVTRIDPQRGMVSGRVHVANEMEWTNVAAAPSAIWYLSSTGSGPVVREIDPARLTVERTYPVVIPGAAALEGVAATRSGACVGVLAARPRVVAAGCVGPGVRGGLLLVRSIGSRPGCCGVAFSTDRAAVILGGGAIRRVDPRTGATLLLRLPRGDVAGPVAVDGPRLWALVERPYARAELWSIAGRMVVRRVTLPIDYAASMAARDGRVWLLAAGGIYVVRSDGVMSHIATVPRRSRGLVATRTALWTAEYLSGTVIEISSR